MSQPLKINTFNQFIEFIEYSNLSNNQITELIETTFTAFYLNEYSKAEMIRLLIEYWEKNKAFRQRPLFIDF
jgi:hypothetical protein